MPLFLSEEEFSRCSGDASLVAVKADLYIRDLILQLETAKAKSDASSITAEQTCTLLEQKYVSLSFDFSNLQSENLSLSSALEKRASELAEVQAEKHQTHLKAIVKDGELERLSVEVSELHKSRRQLLELLEQKDLEIGEKNSLIKSYLDKIVHLSDEIALKEAKLHDIEAESACCHAACARLSQEKELIERHNVWLNDELTAKVNSFIELRKSHTELESDMSAKLADVERQYNECLNSLSWYKESLRELENKLTSVQEELCSTKDTAATNQERFSAEVATVSKLADLYKESAEEWSRKAGDLEGVIKALETHLSQVENDYREKLEKEVSVKEDLEKEALDLKTKLEKCEAEIENARKDNEMSLLPISSFENVSTMAGRWIGEHECNDKSKKEDCLLLVPKVPTGISGTALATSLLRDGWNLVKMYEKYQEAVDALQHERLGRKHSEAVLERVLYEIEEKAEIILDERAEHERMVEAYKLMEQKLQQSHTEDAKLENTIRELKADLRRHERDYDIAQKEVADLEKQVTLLLKECQDIQIRCGGASVVGAEDCLTSDALEIDGDSDVEKIISEQLLTYKDINGLVEQNVQLRSLVRSLSDQGDQRDAELREKFEDELRKHNDEATQKVAAVLQRSEEQVRMVEALHNSVAMYKRLYEEELKMRSAKPISEDGKKDLMLLFEDSHEATKKAHEQVVERARNLEEELAKLRNEAISLRLERDKLIMQANFAREQLERFMKESEHQREETNGIRARNVEFSQLIVDYQKKLRDSADSLLASEELSRKLSMEVSVLKHEKDILATSEKRALDQVYSLTEKVHHLQASLDTIQSAADVREEARTKERRKHEDYVKQIEREWSEAKKELQEERDRVRTLTHDKELTLKDAMREVQQQGKELANALHAVTAAEARAAAAEARCSNLETSIKSSERKIVDVNGGSDLSMHYTNEVAADFQKAKEEIERMKEEAQSNKDHMLQYKEIVQVNEVALKQIESAHENFKSEAERLKSSLEAEIVSLNTRVSELERDVVSKTAEASSAISEKEENLYSAFSEINQLKEENSKKISQLMELEMQISSLREELERKHQCWRTAQDNYERQVTLQSETIQELTKTSQALAALQDENSKLHKLADAQKSEIDVLKATWETEKTLLEKLKYEAEKKYEEINEQNKILHSHLEALHIKLAEKERISAGVSSASSDLDVQAGDGLQTVVSYLRRSKEIAESEMSLLKQEKLRLQSQLESALKASDTAQAILHTERANSRKMLLTDEEFKSLKLQVNELNLLRESNMQIREENKHNFEECQKLRETAQKVKAEADHLNSLLKEKDTQLDVSRKKAEMLNAERANLENRISELLEKTKGFDVEDYNLLKDNYQNIQLKLGEQQAEVEESKKLINQKEEMIVKLEEDLASSQSRILEIEKRLNDTLQAEAVLRAEIEKHKRIISNFKKKADALAKEKEEGNKEKQTLSKQLEDLTNEKQVLLKQMEDVVKEKQSLSKQLEDSRSSKKVIVDTSSEQAMKEKDTRIQILEKTLEREKARRVKVEQVVFVKVTQVQKERERVMEELEKHKLAKDNQQQTSGTLATELPVEIGLNEQATAYMSAVDDLEEAAQSALSDAAVASPVDISAGLAGHQGPQNLINQNPAAVPTSSLQAKSIDEREKRPLVSKPSTETRKMGRRLVRPHLERTQEPSNDVEMPEVEGPPVIEGQTTVEETKPRPSHEPEAQSDPTALLHVPSARKRQASSTASEFREGTPEQESTDGGPVAKKTKDESGEATTDIMPASNEEIADAAKDEAMEESTDMEDVKDPLAGSHQGDLESDSVSIVEELLVEQPGQAEECPGGDPKGTDVPDPQHSTAEVESEKEEGEFVFEGAEQQEGGDTFSSLGDMEAGDSLVEPLIEDSTAEMLPLEVVLIERNVHGEATEEADEGTDKPSEDKPSNNHNSSVLKSSQQSKQVSFGGGGGASSSVVSESLSLKQSIPRSPVKETEDKELQPVRRIVNLGERARENALLRRAGAGVVPTPTPARGRGRAPTLVKRGGRGRGVRGARGQTREKEQG
ncbi:nuclear-pore anchor isoform X2 [Aristolochia californica]|uniref:nuclear-pore anchor isoform X2 n=1 Tax=Aristolochia californica TaxID=171875 RepID=UPI0035D695C3